MLAAGPALALAQAPELDRVTIVGSRPATLPLEIPTTTESVSAAQIARDINATDAEDALKYLPSLNVRKRYIGDHDHAVLATRASGTGNSARSLVYADGILLSNLLGNGATYTPRWGLVTPEEIDRVDVLYGPFAAAYPGNSVGAVVDYVTRMPRAFEAHVKLQGHRQRYELDGHGDHHGGQSASASLGSRRGAWAWWLNLHRLDSDGQPITFPTRPVSRTAVPPAGVTAVPVTGAVAGHNPNGQPWWILGAGSRSHTVQDHAKLKLAHDLTPTLRASYTLAHWRNDTTREARSHLRDAAGAPVTEGYIDIDGRIYQLLPGDFAGTRGHLEHRAQGLTVKSRTRGPWDWEATASRYDYQRDEVRHAVNGVTDLAGTGWDTLALKGLWRPAGGGHTVEGGLQRDAYRLRSRGAQAFLGNTTLASLWVQDAWRVDDAWRAVLGLRAERWRAHGGSLDGVPFAARQETWLSPKAAVSYQPDGDWTLKASLGRAVRAPTVAELYQGSLSSGTIVHHDPDLRPERSWTTEWTAERALPRGQLRATFFAERSVDALYTQALTPTVNAVQNVGEIRTRGLEMAVQARRVVLPGLDLGASLTYAESIIVKNEAFPASVGRWQPRVPRWRAHLLATWRHDERWSGTLGMRYSGRQYGTLDNSDPHGHAYTGVSTFLVSDLRLLCRLDRQWSAAFGIDNLGNERYWAFHPYPQRTFHAELRFDL